MKKIFKRTLAVFLAAVMVLGATPLAGFVGIELPKINGLEKISESFSEFFGGFALKAEAATEYTDGYYTYTVDNNGNARIEDVDTSISGDITIPSTLGGYPVTHIRSYSFRECTNLTSISIPDSVILIDESAFYDCTGLTSITIPDSVTIIGNRAFSGCSGLTNVTIGNGVKSIGYYAFYDCTGLTSISIPDSVILIDESAFYDCTGLTSITIPDSVTIIGDHAFSGCSGLTNVTIGNGVKSIGDYAFYRCSGLASITIPNSVTNIGDYAFKKCTGLTSITIPNSVTNIGDYAFEECTGFTSVTISEGVTSIGDYAFKECTGLTSITIPYGVTSIGDYAFKECRGLTSITIPYGVTSIGNGTFSGCYKLTGITLPDSLTSVGNYAFYGCTGLTSITIPNSVKSIGDSAFYRCSGLTSATLGKSVKSIGDSAFYECTGLTSISVDNANRFYSNDKYGALFDKNKTMLIQYPAKNENESYDIPESVTKICSGAFIGCKSIRNVNIPDSVTEIESGVFGETYFSNMKYWEDPEALYIDNHLIWAVPNSSTYTVKEGTKTIAANAFVTSVSTIIIPDSVVSIGYNAFNENLINITIGNGVKSIGDSAFSESKSLKTVNGAANVEHLGEGVFNENCPYISDESNYVDGVMYVGKHLYKAKTSISGSYQIKAGTTEIGKRAFERCTQITNVTIPDSVTSIGERAFMKCAKLTSIIIPDGVTTIGKYTFDECSSLTSISIPDGVTYIGDRAFTRCEKLTSISIPDGVTYIGEQAFLMCSALTSIVIPDGVTTIKGQTFYECSSLTSITIPNSVTSIGNSAFEKCTGLTSITIPNSVTSIDGYAFRGCIGLSSVIIPDGVTRIGRYAFDGCSGLSNVIIPDSVTRIGSNAFYGCRELHVPANVNVLERGIISSVSCICSDTEDCYAKIYADAYDINFKLCDGSHSIGGLTELRISSAYPAKGATKISSDDDLIFTFNKPIEDSFYFETAEKEISIRNYYTDEPIMVINDKNFLNYWSLIDFSVNTITISGVLSKICPGEKYYITISPGIISAEGDYSKTFAGITDKDEWTFTYSDESEKKGYNFEVYSSRSSFNMNKGETLNAKVVLTLNGEKCSQEGISYTIGDSGIARVKSMSHDESGTTFVIEAVNYGVTNLDIIYKAGSLRESYIIKIADEKTIYYLEDIKGRSQDKDPFYTCGLYVDDLNYTESADGRANVTFDVYNYSHCYGAVEVRDASGNLVNSEMISMFNGEYNTDFVSYGTYVYKVGRDVFNGNFIDNDVYKTDVKTQKTSIDISVPKGGYIVITKNVSESMPCLLYNITLLAIEAASSTAKIINNSKFKSNDEIIENIVEATAKKITWKEIAHMLSSEAAKSIAKDFIKAGNEVNISAVLNATEGIYMNLDEIYKTFEINWKELVISTIKDCAPDIAVEFATDFALDSIGGDIADLFFSAVGIGKYCEILMEVTDYTDVSGTYIYNSQKGNTRYSNKVIAKSDAIPDNVVFHSVLIKSGNISDVYNGYTESYEEAELYDISLVKNGNKTQPDGKVQVHIPIPSGWNANEITVHHEISYRKYEKLDVTIEDGYIVFYTDSFSNFIIANGNVTLSTPEVEIRNPSTTTISYGDCIVLHTDITEALPNGWYIEWTADNGNFSYYADGETCRIDPNKSGSTTFTATIYDAQGNAVSKDEQTMTSKAGFFQKIIAFFKKLFGLTKVIAQSLNTIY